MITIDWDKESKVYVISVESDEESVYLKSMNIQSLFKLKNLPNEYYMIPHYSGVYILSARLNAEEATWTEDALAQRELTAKWRDECRRAYSNVNQQARSNMFAYQVRNSNMLNTAGCGFIHDQTGLGKTRTMIDVCSDIPGPHLVVCPAIAKNVWRNEIAKYDKSFDVVVIEGTPKQRAAQLADVNKYDFVIINYELLKKHVSYPAWTDQYPGDFIRKELDDIVWGAILLDEGHRIKNPTAIATRCCWRLADNSKHRYVMTATPITQNPYDLWSQLRFIHPEEWLARSKFRDRYLRWVEGPHGGVEILGWNSGMEGEFKNIMGWRTSVRTYDDPDVKAELTSVPVKMTPEVIEVEMTAEQKRQYKLMVENMMIIFEALDEDTFAFAASDVERWVRLRQCANGVPVIDEQGEVVALNTPSNKVNAIFDLLDGVDGPTVIFAEHSKVAGMIHDALHRAQYKSRLIVGATSTEARSKYIEEFQDGKIDTLVATTRTAGVSISLTNARLMIIAQESTSLLDQVQAMGRVHRIGTTVSVPIITLRSKSTVELALAEGNLVKADFLERYLDSPAAYRKLLLGNLD